VIVVDTSVWVDYFNGTPTPQTDRLDALLGEVPLAIGDVILIEVLQGFRADRDFRHARDLLSAFDCFPMLGEAAAIRCAEYYRTLRKRGVTVRKTADVIIATFCIAHGHALLYADRDFDPFAEHLGLIPVL